MSYEKGGEKMQDEKMKVFIETVAEQLIAIFQYTYIERDETDDK
ncbi:hypothetical protein [Carnobacterium jeotgali]|nr:hypothetical protein [Carnobacterium jeotgali]